MIKTSAYTTSILRPSSINYIRLDGLTTRTDAALRGELEAPAQRGRGGARPIVANLYGSAESKASDKHQVRAIEHSRTKSFCRYASIAIFVLPAGRV